MKRLGFAPATHVDLLASGQKNPADPWCEPMPAARDSLDRRRSVMKKRRALHS